MEQALSTETAFFQSSYGKIVYSHYQYSNDANRPGVIFLHGYRSDRFGEKIKVLAEQAKTAQYNLLAFDSLAHGESEGDFEEYTIGKGLDVANEMLVALTKGPQIIIGSSMGGWHALLLALRAPERIHAVITLAAAPDFVAQLLWPSFSAEQKETLLLKGRIALTRHSSDPYYLGKSFFLDARSHQLLHGNPIPIACPVRMLHGMEDADVPYDFSLRACTNLTSEDAHTILIKGGDHRLVRLQDLTLLKRTVESLI
jgi:pimeloyl-ACP methyl ester carboxylesterase